MAYYGLFVILVRAATRTDVPTTCSEQRADLQSDRLSPSSVKQKVNIETVNIIANRVEKVTLM
jgi:hypothetical protein